MKTIAIGSLFVLFVAVAGINAVPSALADHAIANVGFKENSGFSQDCVETDDCYTPATVTVDAGGEVIWTNEDNTIHTVASGGLDDLKADTIGINWPDGAGAEGNTGFQSWEEDGEPEDRYMNPGDMFKYKFDVPGEYPYFCTLHPWMTGTVIVEGDAMDGDKDEHDAMDGDAMDGDAMDGDAMDGDAMDGDAMDGDAMDGDAMDGDAMDGDAMDGDAMDGDAMDGDAMHPMSIDDVMAEITTGEGMMGSPLTIDVTITNMDGEALEHVNFKVTAMQGDEVVYETTDKEHSHTGIADQITTAPLPADPSEEMPVDITVELLGFGVDEIEGPSGELATAQVVPEFGTIAMMILGIAIVSIIAVTAKSRVIPRI